MTTELDATLSDVPGVNVTVQSMTVNLTVNLAPSGLTERLAAIQNAVTALTSQGEANMGRMEEAVERMRVAVERNTTVDESVKTLLADIAGQLRANMNNPAAIEALASKLEGDNSSLADAVTANTDLATPPAPDTGGTPPDTSGGGTPPADTGGDTGGPT